MEKLAGTGDGVALVVEQAADLQCGFDVAAAVKALAGAALAGLELRELAFPEAQDERLDAEQTCGLADAEVELVRDGRGWESGRLSALLFRSRQLTPPRVVRLAASVAPLSRFSCVSSRKRGPAMDTGPCS